MRILYLHGLGSDGLMKGKRDILEKNLKSRNIYSPLLDYYQNEIENKIESIFRKDNYDLIIGSSTGAMVAHALSALYGTKAILMNPAFSHPIVDKLMPKLIRSTRLGDHCIYVFGSEDNVVPIEGTQRFLSIDHFPKGRSMVIEGMEHRIRVEELNQIFSSSLVQSFITKETLT
ncbi:hypothetical protein K5X82_03355 [Halosquirtibacter xylanolyticus]|uniref:YqiA/YcfP family alpha/beta fold hydrolase n=1 Tax=Halosquirtibacter xylanolyticus TaxID=3374599 RepID=UPI00374A7E51|nr:hypothetical protein K5X82_03355 [Prolixibacteraceae bacterium]